MKVDTILVALLVLFLMFLLFGGRVSGFSVDGKEDGKNRVNRYA